MCHTVHAGNAVVHGDQHIGARVFHALGDRCGQAIAIDDAVGHDVGHMLGPQKLQAAQGYGAGGGAIAVIVGHHTQAFICGNRIGQQFGGLWQAFHGGGGQ